MRSRHDLSVARWERRLHRLVLALGRLAWGAPGYGRARGVLRIFYLAERVAEYRRRLRSLQPGGVLRYEIAPLPSRALPLPAQPAVEHGERVIILHWDNESVARVSAAAPSTHALTWQMARATISDMKSLAAMVQAGAFPNDVRAAWCETVIYMQLARYGLSTRPAPRALRTPFVRLYQIGLISIYGRDGLARLDGRRPVHMPLGEAWIALDDVPRHFPPLGSRH